jgi:hypothetical protein
VGKPVPIFVEHCLDDELVQGALFGMVSLGLLATSALARAGIPLAILDA